MTRLRYLTVPLLVAGTGAHAIVIRDDVPEHRYHAERDEFPALADLPGEGHGVLIAPRWVLTAAHATQWQTIPAVTIGGKTYAVAKLIVHPGYRTPSEALLRGDAAPLMAALAASDDIALIHLAAPVEGVAPVAMYRRSDERGRSVTLYGAGASGDGRHGQDPQAPHRTRLRRATNVIAAAEGRWLTYRFDAGAQAQALEGMPGNGDSGGPVLIGHAGSWQLAGLASWKSWHGDLADFRGGIYGQVSYQVRVSHYRGWIDGVIADEEDRGPAKITR